jgi:endonuclease/exonuclease/phosphatase family metal-dependent hydrolase
MSYNIRYGGTGREEHLASVIKACDPDLVVFQEATKPRVIEALSKKTGMNIWAAREGYSLGFMSRLDIDYYEWHLPKRTRRHFLEIVPKDIDIRIFGIHLSAIHSNLTEQRRVRELYSLLDAIEKYREGFHVLVGDFNTLAPGELLDLKLLPFRLRAFVWITGGNIRWRTIQIMLDSGYTDGYRMLYPHDKGYTFPTWNPHIRLDFLFLPTSFSNRLEMCKVVNDHKAVKDASDHLPLMAHIKVDSIL